MTKNLPGVMFISAERLQTFLMSTHVSEGQTLGPAVGSAVLGSTGRKTKSNSSFKMSALQPCMRGISVEENSGVH